MPVTIPVGAPTVAAELPAMLHAPPDVASPSVTVDPMHTFSVPVIGAGSGSTIKGAVVWQPVDPSVYVIVSGPATIPVIAPVSVDIDAKAGLLNDQDPPPVASVNVVVAPIHTFGAPPIDAGNGFTTIDATVEQVVGKV